MTTVRFRCLALAAALLAACTGHINGTWDDASGDLSYEFYDGGRLRILALGSVVNGEYAIDGDRVLLTSPQGAVVLRRDGNRLTGPMGAEFRRRGE